MGIWAQGPWAHLIHGTHQQSYLATVMAYAGCVGKYSKREGCTDAGSGGSSLAPGSAWSGALLLTWLLVATWRTSL